MSNSLGFPSSTNSTPFQHGTQLERSTAPLDTISHQVDRNDKELDKSKNQGIAQNQDEQQVNSVINISNSNDVVIGPMMQYHGEVTIYQYMEANLGGDPLRPKALEIGNTDSPYDHQTEETPNKKRHFWKIVGVIILVSGFIGLTGPYMTFLGVQELSARVEEERGPPEILFSTGYAKNKIPNLGNDHIIIDRKQWGAAKVSVAPSLEHPIPHVIITHVGGLSNPCDSVYNCSIKMRTIQDKAIAEQNKIDIKANFYVSSDGYIYVGRGWNFQNEYTTRSVAVCFMGDYNEYEPTWKQLEGVAFLLEYGITKGYLNKDYLLVAHNQTANTKSPGRHVYRKIVRWPHWYWGCGVGEAPLCSWK